MKLRLSLFLALGAVARASAAATGGGDYLITDFGAKADAPALSTVSIQACIDACAKTGGRVIVPPGTYRIGTLYLKSNVDLHLARNATLSGSTRLSDYPENHVALRSYSDRYVDRALIWADDQSSVAITGDGTIQGNGDQRYFPHDPADAYRTYPTRPYLIRLVACRKVQIEGVTLLGAAMWMQQYLGCTDVRITGITSYNHGNVNNDGLDIDSCQRVVVSDCRIDSEDDGICLKSTALAPCEAVTISNCVVSSNCSAIKLGTESTGGFRDIAISNCVVKPSACTTEKEGNRLGKSAIALMVVDGGTMEHILVDNISVQDVDVPLFIRLGSRGNKYAEAAPAPGVGVVRDIMISNVIAHGSARLCSSITGIPGHPVEDVTLSNITLISAGGGKVWDPRQAVPENEAKYPGAAMFGDNLPASGLFIRHARGVVLRNVSLRCEAPDERPRLVLDDVQKTDLEPGP